jgi:hypothetical protein
VVVGTQVIYDVDLHKLLVRFAMDRAGLVGADGPTQSGSFDVTYMAPSYEAESFHMVATSAAIDDRPSCFRYPRGYGIGVPLPPGNKDVPLEVIILFLCLVFLTQKCYIMLSLSSTVVLAFSPSLSQERMKPDQSFF